MAKENKKTIIVIDKIENVLSHKIKTRSKLNEIETIKYLALSLIGNCERINVNPVEVINDIIKKIK